MHDFGIFNGADDRSATHVERRPRALWFLWPGCHGLRSRAIRYTKVHLSGIIVGDLDQKHHYIPVFYLNQWRGLDDRLCEYSRPYDVVKPKRVHQDGTGYVRGLYAIEGFPPQVTNILETNFLKPADGLAANALIALVEGREFVKPAQMRTSWSRFVLSLMLRNPEAIADMKHQLRERVRTI